MFAGRATLPHPKKKDFGPPITGAALWLSAAGVLLALGGAAWFVHEARLAARLVRSDPKAIAGDAQLLRVGAARGGVVYRDQCASCHGLQGKGDPAMGVPDLTDADWLFGEGRVSDIEKVVAYGIRAPNPRSWSLAVMPAYGQAVPSAKEGVPPLTPGEIAAVTDYLLVLGGQPADPESARHGAQIYGGKGGCYDCHTDDAKGDRAIGAPNLTDSTWLYGDGSRAAITYSITHGRQGVSPAWSGRLSPLDLREVSLYVYALSHGAIMNEAR
jgi:cytochrome c oxidase cbb3-type subunit 3